MDGPDLYCVFYEMTMFYPQRFEKIFWKLICI